MKNQNINTNPEYKYGFTTDIENIRAPKGLYEETIKFISQMKKEPQWMLEWRVKASNRLQSFKEPHCAETQYLKNRFQDLYYYSSPQKAPLINQKV
jgi:ABC-type transport system involved in Fe-S cluster assembly, permease component